MNNRHGVSSRLSFNRLVKCGCVLVVFGLFSQACQSDKGAGTVGAESGSGNEGGGNGESMGGDIGAVGGAPGEDETPSSSLYLISTSLLIDDTAISYMTTVPSLTAGGRVDLKNSVEFGGGARAYGPEGASVVYVTSSEDATLTEVTIDANGTPKKGRAVSFAGLGITGTTGGNLQYFVSPTKAYFISQETLEIVLWNPELMEIVTTIPLEIPMLSTSTFLSFSPQPIVVNNQLIVLSGESDDDDVAASPVVSVVDLATDTVVSSVREPRCHSLSKSALDKRGNRYFASDGYAAAVHFKTPKIAPAPCMLRMLAGATTFDPDWSRSFTEELGTSLWTGVTPGSDGTFYVQAIAEDEPSVQEADDAYSVTIAQPWTWYALSDGDAAPEPFSSPLFVAQPLFPDLLVGGDRFITSWDDKDTTLIELTSDEIPTKALNIPGFVFNIVKVR